MKGFLVTTVAAMACMVGGTVVADAARPRYYVRVQDVKDDGAAACAIKEQGRRLLLQALDKDPSVITRLGQEPPPQDKALERVLKARKLEGYGLILRITKCAHELHPPAAGKVYKVLMVEVAVGLDAEKIPSGQIARAGNGDAQVGTEVSSVKPRELAQLRVEALKEAVGQAAGEFIKSLKARSPVKKKRRRKRR